MDRPGSGFRRLVGLLLALNLGVLAAGLGFTYWPRQTEAPPEFNGEKVKFLATPEDVVATRPPAEPPADAAPAPAQPDAGADVPLCLNWKSLDADQFLAVEAHLKQLGIPADGYLLALPARLGWWVYLPPQRDAEALRVAMEDLRQKGVKDMAQVRGGKLSNAISLGAFPTVRKAREHAASLAAKGVAGLKLGPRPEAGEVRLTLTDAASANAADALAGDWPQGLKPGVCPAP